MVRVILADDHKILRDGIRSLLQADPEITVVDEASNGKEVIEKIPSNHPDLVLMDLTMPEMDGIETSNYIRDHFPTVKVLILSMLDEQHKVKQLLDLGAGGYILKSSGQEELTTAIKIVASGGNYISPEITMKLLNKMNTNGNEELNIKTEKTSEISKRELEVLRLIAQGYTNGEIADKLFNSKRTIESHRRNLIEKTKTRNTAELINYAIKSGLLD